MREFARTILIVTQTHLLRVARSRRMLVMLALAAVPSMPLLIISRVRHRGEPAELVSHATWIILLQIAVPLVALIGSSAAAAEEISDRTITYAFTRPISRAAFFLGRWVATLCSVTLVLVLSVGLLFAAIRHSEPMLTGFQSPLFRLVLGTTLLGGAVYAALFAALGAKVRHPMIIGLGYCFALEGLLANFPGQSQDLAIQYHLRSALAGFGGPEWRWAAVETLSVVEPGPEALRTLLVVLLAALLLGCWWIRRREDV
jgi:hypothetical protein